MREVRTSVIAGGNRFFIDKISHESIVCAFDSKSLCSPDCASCDIDRNTDRAECGRGDFEIAIVKQK